MKNALMRPFLPLLIFCVILVACNEKTATPVVTAVNTLLTVEPSVTVSVITSTPRPHTTILSQPTIFSTVTLAPTATFTEVNLARPLYLLTGNESTGGRDLYKLMPESKIVEHLNPDGEDINCFDIWNGDERLAFGTKQGKLFTQLRNEKPHLLLDTSVKSPYPTQINGVSWSPDGKRLAYTVDYRDHELHKVPYPSRPSGVWVVDFQGSNPIWLISNNYVPPEVDSVASRRSFEDPIWSPDSQALIVHNRYWEGSERVWFDPIRPVKDDRSLLRDPDGGVWSEAAWSTDGQAVLLSGLGYTDYGSLIWVSRNGQKDSVLIDGAKNKLYIDNVFVFEDGLFFIAVEGDANKRGGLFLYYASTKDSQIKWSKFTPNPICAQNGILNSTKGPGGNQITLLCGRDLQVISSAGNLIDHTDLSTLLKNINAPIISIKWGMK